MTADDAGWDYKPDGQNKSDEPSLGARSHRREPVVKSKIPDGVEWTASEYIEHNRGFAWYVALIVTTVALTALIYWVTKDYFAAAVAVATGIVVAVFALHTPREITYVLGRDGLQVGEKLYPFAHFKSFAVIREGGLSSVNLIPVKRFMPIITAYFEPDKEIQIVQSLGQYLPYEQRNLDGVERLSRRLRF